MNRRKEAKKNGRSWEEVGSGLKGKINSYVVEGKTRVISKRGAATRRWSNYHTRWAPYENYTRRIIHGK